MSSIPISLLYFTSTKQHYDHKDVYLVTLNHLDKEIPLLNFKVKVAHIKITPGEEALAETMEKELVGRGFKVLTTTAGWKRGTSHQIGYMSDVIKISKELSVYENNHVMWLEDDSLMVSNKPPLIGVLHKMIQLVESSPEILTARFLRRGDLSTSPIMKKDESGDFFYSPHFNFQPAIMRSRDFYQACRVIEANPEATAQVQCEMLWRLVLAPLSPSDYKHIVWYPDFAETIHIGVPDYLKIKAELGL